jgi:hypothetical protein
MSRKAVGTNRVRNAQSLAVKYGSPAALKDAHGHKSTFPHPIVIRDQVAAFLSFSRLQQIDGFHSIEVIHPMRPLSASSPLRFTAVVKSFRRSPTAVFAFQPFVHSAPFMAMSGWSGCPLFTAPRPPIASRLPTSAALARSEAASVRSIGRRGLPLPFGRSASLRSLHIGWFLKADSFHFWRLCGFDWRRFSWASSIALSLKSNRITSNDFLARRLSSPQ